MAEGKIWEANPFESFEQINKLQSLCKQYMQNYDIAGLENKYRDVYELSGKLPKVSNIEEFTQLKEQLKTEQFEKLIADNNLVFVEGGTYIMGEGKEAHKVTVSDFYIGKYEVTFKEWYRLRKWQSGYKNYYSDDAFYCFSNSLDGWEEAMAYCKWLEEQYGGTWRLPTEAEWEYAARGGNKSKGYTYSGSDNYDEVGWTSDSGANTKPVGQKKSNELGIYDMSGNAGELCLDWYDKNYYASSQKENPTGPPQGKKRVIRGIRAGYGGGKGSIYDRTGVRVRKGEMSFYQHYRVGFRVVYIPD